MMDVVVWTNITYLNMVPSVVSREVIEPLGGGSY